MSNYAGDVRKLLLLGGPNGGIDYFLRHPVQDKGATNWPMAWNTVTLDGTTTDTREYLMGPQGYWPGQGQLVARWDDRFPLPEWDASGRKTYYGGSTPQFQADGIQKAIESGDHFLEKLQATPLASDVEVGLLAGNHSDVPGFKNETVGPSDGIILLDSALTAPKDAQVKTSEVLPCNHLELVLGEQAQERLAQFLSGP